MGTNTTMGSKNSCQSKGKPVSVKPVVSPPRSLEQAISERLADVDGDVATKVQQTLESFQVNSVRCSDVLCPLLSVLTDPLSRLQSLCTRDSDSLSTRDMKQFG